MPALTVRLSANALRSALGGLGVRGGSSDVKIPVQINDVKGGAARSYLKCSDDLIAEIIKKLN